jgi:alkylation response protein AidB-like acyl-CoA dehydrogenase
MFTIAPEQPLDAPCLHHTLTRELTSFSPARVGPAPKPDAAAGYLRVTLHREPAAEVAAARWRAGGESALHGHAGSAALYAVAAGALLEERYLPDSGTYHCEVAVLRPGVRSYLPPGSFHRVRALEESVTVHVYAPAPADATTPLPPETVRLLEQARNRARELDAVIRPLLDGWAEREACANREGAVSLPQQTLDEIRTSGVLAAPLPRERGGWGASLGDTAAAVRLVAQRAPATALALVMPLGNAATARIPEAAVAPALRPALRQGQDWIAAQVGRGLILAVANSEPGAGGDLASTRTCAERDAGGRYRLTGRKSFATFGRDADYFLCAARRSAAGAGRADVVDGFFVARHAPGLTVDDRWNPVGMRPTASVGLTLEGAAAEAILGYPGCLEGVNARHWSTVLFAAVFLGVGEGALREGVRQTPPDAAWAQATLAEHALNLEAAAGFIEAVAADERWPLPATAQERARRAKTFVARAAVETAVHAAMISGGRCYTPDHPVFRFLCDALAGPLLRPPLPRAMDALVQQLFPPTAAAPRPQQVA